MKIILEINGWQKVIEVEEHVLQQGWLDYDFVEISNTFVTTNMKPDSRRFGKTVRFHRFPERGARPVYKCAP